MGIYPLEVSVRGWCLVGSSVQYWSCRWEPPGGFVRQRNACQGFNSSFCLPTSNSSTLVHLGECYVLSAILTGLLQFQGYIPAWRRTCCLHSYWSMCQLWVWEAENNSLCVWNPSGYTDISRVTEFVNRGDLGSAARQFSVICFCPWNVLLVVYFLLCITMVYSSFYSSPPAENQ